MVTAQQLWLAPHADRYAFTQLDALSALYDRASGQTHLLAQPLPEILAALADGPASAADIAAKLRADFDIDDGEGLRARIAECLNELAALGLVSQA